MSISHITSTSELNAILSKSSDKLSVIDFHATWCGPCHMIAPTFEALAKQYKNVNFLKCDVDAAKDVASAYRVKAMPTFVFLKGSTKVEQIQGAQRGALEDAVRRHLSGSSSGAFTGKGQTLGGSSPSTLQIESPSIFEAFNKLDPQVKVLLYLVAGYLLFYYIS
ncbi:thioredoxin-domain-containing protein [Wolfiporia cocos MD-104 SS10]|uniref:Thioredoxin n=1 Tax=Wolfiporia cocos (strain MD-104) TaxID=742152 RepID=A0A2H3IX78_WOLCO|nr:thioredoxin-domain-containing protein [Wolfiporia cocos MD-104 SS10]